FAAVFPRTTRALERRQVRAELLAAAGLKADPPYRALAARRRELMKRAVAAAQAADASNAARRYVAGSRKPLAAARRLFARVLVQDQKLRLLKREQEEPSAAKDPAQRTIEETFFDHLRARREGQLEKDLRENYSPDLIFTSNQGNFFGREEVRRSAAILAQL